MKKARRDNQALRKSCSKITPEAPTPPHHRHQVALTLSDSGHSSPATVKAMQECGADRPGVSVSVADLFL